MPLFFENSSDYSKIEENDSIIIDNIVNQLRTGNKVTCKLIKADGKTFDLTLRHSLNSGNVEIIIAGGILNQK